MLNDRFETSTVARLDKCQGAPPVRGGCDLRSGDGHAGGRSLAEPQQPVFALALRPRRAIWGQRTLLVAYCGSHLEDRCCAPSGTLTGSTRVVKEPRPSCKCFSQFGKNVKTKMCATANWTTLVLSASGGWPQTNVRAA
jgi:hypothetical protein